MAVQTASQFHRTSITWMSYLFLGFYSFLISMVSPAMPFLGTELGLSDTLTALHVSAFSAGVIVTGLIGERIVARLGRRRMLWMSIFIVAGGCIWFILARNVVLTLGSCLLMGFFGSWVQVVVQALLSDEHQEHRAVALTEANILASIGSAIAPLAISTLQRTVLGWRAALVAATFAVPALAFAYFRQSVPEEHQPADTTGKTSERLPARFWMFWVLMFACVALEWCMVFWCSFYMEREVGLTKIDAVTVMGFFMAISVLGRFIGSRLTRRFRPTVLLAGAILTLLVGFIPFWFAWSKGLAIGGLLLSGIGVANLFPLAMAITVAQAPHLPNIASARISFGVGLAILSAPLTLGWLSDRMDLHTAYAVVPILIVLNLTMLFVFTRRKLRVTASQAG